MRPWRGAWEKRIGRKVRRARKENGWEWEVMAKEGDHYKLAFDAPGTWSQKYNLVWDQLLGLGLFDPNVKRTELSFYARPINTVWPAAG